MAPRSAVKRQDGAPAKRQEGGGWLEELAMLFSASQEEAAALLRFATTQPSDDERGAEVAAALSALSDAQAEKAVHVKAAQRLLRLCHSVSQALELDSGLQNTPAALYALLLRHLHRAGSGGHLSPEVVNATIASLNSLTGTIVTGVDFNGAVIAATALGACMVRVHHAATDEILANAVWKHLAPSILAALRWTGTMDSGELAAPAAPNSRPAIVGALVRALDPLIAFLLRLGRELDPQKSQEVWERRVPQLCARPEAAQGLFGALRALAAARATAARAPPGAETPPQRQARLQRQDELDFQAFADYGLAGRAPAAPCHSALSMLLECLRMTLQDTRELPGSVAGKGSEGAEEEEEGEEDGDEEEGEEEEAEEEDEEEEGDGDCVADWAVDVVGVRGVQALVASLAALPPVAVLRLLAACLERTIRYQNGYCAAFVEAGGVETVLTAAAGTPALPHSSPAIERAADGFMSSGLHAVFSCLACLIENVKLQEIVTGVVDLPSFKQWHEWRVAQRVVAITPLPALLKLLARWAPLPSTDEELGSLESRTEPVFPLYGALTILIEHLVSDSANLPSERAALAASPEHLRVLGCAAAAELEIGCRRRMHALNTLHKLAISHPEAHPALRPTLAKAARSLLRVLAPGTSPTAEASVLIEAGKFLGALVQQKGPEGDANVTFLEKEMGTGCLVHSLGKVLAVHKPALEAAQREGDLEPHILKNWSQAVRGMVAVVVAYDARPKQQRLQEQQAAERQRAAADAAADALLAEEEAVQAAVARKAGKAAKRKQKAAAKKAAEAAAAAEEQRRREAQQLAAEEERQREKERRREAAAAEEQQRREAEAAVAAAAEATAAKARSAEQRAAPAPAPAPQASAPSPAAQQQQGQPLSVAGASAPQQQGEAAELQELLSTLLPGIMGPPASAAGRGADSAQPDPSLLQPSAAPGHAVAPAPAGLATLAGAAAAAVGTSTPAPASPSLLEAALVCPLTGRRMEDPCILSCGHSFERAAAAAWVAAQGTCPLTGKAVASGSLRPNLALRQLLQQLD
eukprot:scaffold9.g3060.t1